MNRYPLTMLLTLLSVLYSSCRVGAQNRSISGQVVDAKTNQTLPGVAVFIDGTSVATFTDSSGFYKLAIPPEVSTVTVIVSLLGYVRSVNKMAIPPALAVNLPVRLMPDSNTLGEVQVIAKKDKEWEKQYKRFKYEFLGNSPFARKCVIENPHVINFSEDKSHFKAYCNEPIKIINQSLGYTVFFYLKEFTLSSGRLNMAGHTYFQPLPGNEERALFWKKNRQLAYQGSPRHFFKSAGSGKLRAEGFEVYVQKKAIDRSKFLFWLSDPGTFKKINRDDLGILQADSLLSLTSTYPIWVFYTATTNYEQAIFKDMPYSTSVVTIKKPALVYTNGLLSDPLGVEMAGAWSQDRVAGMLPVNFDPIMYAPKPETESTTPAGQLYVFTDKDVYGLGETVWCSVFSTGLAYQFSQPVFMKLVDGNKKIITAATCSLENGFSDGYLNLPDTLASGTYFLVIYTNWSKNYPQTSYSRPIHFVNVRKGYNVRNVRQFALSDTVAVSLQPAVDLAVTIAKMDSLQKEIVLSINAVDKNRLWSKMALSVTTTKPTGKQRTARIDANWPPADQHVPISSILNAIPDSLLSFTGRVRSRAGKSLANHTLTMLSLDPDFKFYAVSNSDADGRFTVNRLKFQGDLPVVIRVTNKQGREVTDADVSLDDWLPEINLYDSSKTVLPKEILKQFADIVQTADTTLYGSHSATIRLDQVIVKGKKENTQPELEGVGQSHSKADVTLTFNENSYKYSSVLDMIRKAGGVQVYELDGKVQVQIRGASNLNGSPQEATIVHDGVYIQAGTLKAISPDNVSRIEVLKGASASVYGLLGGGGVIAIYSKKGDQNQTPNDRSKVYTLRGIQADRSFDQVVMMSTNHRTLSWNGNLSLNAAARVNITAPADCIECYITLEGVDTRGEACHIERVVRFNNLVEK